VPTPYCHPLDVLRRFDPSLTLADLGSDVIGIQDTGQVEARIRSASQEFDSDTRRPMRIIRVGSPDSPSTYGRHDVSGSKQTPPLLINLEYGDVVPFDPDAGDTLEIRVGRDSWRDVTADRGGEWVLDNDRGQLRIFRFLLSNLRFEDRGERFVRLSYRAGGLGGGRDRGGETALAGDVTDSSTTLSVAGASRLPYDGGLAYLPASDPADAEYVQVTDVDTDNGELTVERGVRGTDGAAHPSGTAVHYCPPDVRDAVAAYAAAELVRYDLANQRTDADDQAVPPSDKLEDWADEWERTKRRYSNVRTL
jgi:hypothetical protein